MTESAGATSKNISNGKLRIEDARMHSSSLYPRCNTLLEETYEFVRIKAEKGDS